MPETIDEKLARIERELRTHNALITILLIIARESFPDLIAQARAGLARSMPELASEFSNEDVRNALANFFSDVDTSLAGNSN